MLKLLKSSLSLILCTVTLFGALALSASPVSAAESNSIVQSVSYTPYATTLININKCKLNSNLKFGQLKVGTYTLKIVATDNQGNSTTWTQRFSVK